MALSRPRYLFAVTLAVLLTMPVVLSSQSSATGTEEPPLHPVTLAAAGLASPRLVPSEWHKADQAPPPFSLVAGSWSRTQAATLARLLGVPLAPATETPITAAKRGQGLISIAPPQIVGDSARVGVLWYAPGWLQDLKERPIDTRTCIYVFGESKGKWDLVRSLCTSG